MHRGLSCAREQLHGADAGLKPSISGQFGVFVCQTPDKVATDGGREGVSLCPTERLWAYEVLADIHDSWTTLRQTLAPLQRTTTSFRRRDGRTLNVRKTASASPEQAEIYRAMGLAPPPRNLAKTIV